MILIQFWKCLSSHGVLVQALRLLGSKNTSPAGPGEKVSYPHLKSPGVVSTQRIQAAPQSHLIREFVGGFTYAISVFDQH